MTETLNGTVIHFEIHGAGDPVLLLHGFTGSSQDWRKVAAEWNSSFRVIVPDLRGHGQSGALTQPFRHQDAAGDMLALLDHLQIERCKALGISCGGNVLLHMAVRRPPCLTAMVLVSATPYFPPQARAIMRQYPDTQPGGGAQMRALLESTRSFADSYDDLNFTPPYLSTIQARTLIVQGDRDPLYPVELSLEMYRAIPHSSLWILPNSGHGPVIGERWPQFLIAAADFLRA